ncbi:Transcriptional regulator, ArsR family (plasmid) [Deinococcus gobiensis I-0]|nr:Transcriptional regulator, ArsR family [Deinococcus gobiensis I-0]
MYYALSREPFFRLGGQLLLDLFSELPPLTHQSKSVC